MYDIHKVKKTPSSFFDLCVNIILMIAFYKTIFKNALFRISCALFAFFSLWWGYLHITHATLEQFQGWNGLYQLTALFGAISGLIISKKWGGLKSTMGRATLMFSTGLFFQVIAQSAGYYYAYMSTAGTVPYPSLSDVGAFGALILYSIGVIFLAKASGAHISLRSYKGKLLAILIPILFLSVSFAIFLRSYEYDWSQPLTTFLDIGYPLGESFYLSMAILAYFLSRKFLGGIMKMPILFFIAALVAEYVADFLFLYDSHSGSYMPGGFNDLLFVVSYSLMAISIIQLGAVVNLIKET